MAYVYKHTRTDKNEVFYIGIGSDSNYDRSIRIYGRNIHWKRIIKQTDYSVEIIEDNLDWAEACVREKYWIKFYGRSNLKNGTLCNMTDGGEGTIGRICNEETRNKIGIKSKEKIYSEEYKKKISNSVKGKNNPMFGRHHSDETKRKISKKETGELHFFYGKKKTEITKQRISNSQPYKKSVVKFDSDGKLISTYPSMGIASKKNNISEGNLSAYLNKPLITKNQKVRILGGYVWKLE
jgi:group I intron endonuclease